MQISCKLGHNYLNIDANECDFYERMHQTLVFHYVNSNPMCILIAGVSLTEHIISEIPSPIILFLQTCIDSPVSSTVAFVDKHWMLLSPTYKFDTQKCLQVFSDFIGKEI